VSGSSDSFYKPTHMDKEVLLKKMLKCDREYKEKMKMDEQPMNLDLMEDSIQVFKIFKLLQRMKNK
jgi:hypothetical protein